MNKKIDTYGICSMLLIACIVACGKNNNTTPAEPGGDEISYEVSTEVFPNPERGFIKTFATYSEGAGFDANDLTSLRAQNVSLILRLFYLDMFKDKALSSAQLELVRNDLGKVREAGLKAIVRFAYTDDMNGTDAPLDIVLQHLEQLKVVFEENEDVIAFVQAGFIGAWGEWHSSSNGLSTIENQRTVLEKLIEVVPASIMIQVRTPGYKQKIFNTAEPVSITEVNSNASLARVGHHNDCFLSGGDNYGTYGNIAAEKEYISKEALYVPTGGETCPPLGGYDPTCEESRKEMKLLKWTYLNLDWYPATISAWKSSGCFEEFHTYLGYRLALVKGNLPATASLGGDVKVLLSLTNKGYAPLYHLKNVSLVLKNKASGTFYDLPLQFDVRRVKPLATVDIDESVSLAGIPAGKYELYMRIADKAESLAPRLEYAVRLANKNGWVEEHGGINKLNHELTIQ